MVYPSQGRNRIGSETWRERIERYLAEGRTVSGGDETAGGTPSSGAPTGTSPSPAPSTGAPGTSPSPTPTPTTGTSVSTPASGTPPVATTPPSTLPANEPNLDVLRQSHRTLSELGDPEVVRAATNVWNDVTRLGQELNYTPESLKAAFKADPLGTLQTLRQESQTYRSSPQYQDDQRINEAVTRATQPLQQYIATEMANKHNATINNEFDRLFSANDAFKPRVVNGQTVSVDPKFQNMIKDRFLETIKWNEGLLKEVVQGKTSGLQKVFDEVTADTLAAVNAYSAWGAPLASGTPNPGSTTPTGTPARAPNGRFVPTREKPVPEGFTLDDIIEGRATADFLPSMRGFQQ